MSKLEYISVSFQEKDNAKRLGAKWDCHEKKWYIPFGLSTRNELLKIYNIYTSIDELVGEDRSFGGSYLFVDLIPQSCWFSSARACIHPSDWDRVRNHVYKRVDYKCECCGINTKEHDVPLEAHERWDYNNETKIQKLVRIIALCQQCHRVTHIGFAGILGEREKAIKHLQHVRRFTEEQCDMHIKDAFNIWEERNKYNWKLDLSLLESNGIKLVK